MTNTMKLNQKQKEYVLDNFFEPWDFYDIFEHSKEYLIKNTKLSIDKKENRLGDRTLYMVLLDEEYAVTELNFEAYPEKWDEILKLA